MFKSATRLVMMVLLVGCGRSAPPPTSRAADSEMAKAEQAVDILDYVAGILNTPAESESVESASWDLIDPNEAARRALETGVAPVLVPQLNQWIYFQSPLPDWRRDPLIETLPPALAKMPQLKGLQAMGFAAADGLDLRQAVWLREASNWAAGATQDDIERARRVFDWIVRNIQLDPPYAEDAVPRQAWQTLLLGRGPASDRAWLFVLMARQQGLDVVMLATVADDGTTNDWLPALVHEGQLYLFDPALGLPVPGLGRKGIATLEQVAQDDSLLRQLDLDDEHRYHQTAASVERMIALVEASPMYLAQRMALLESHLAGDKHVALSVDASALADRLRSIPHIADVRLWPLPYQRLIDQARLGSEGRQRLASEFEPFMVPFGQQITKEAKKNERLVTLVLTPALWKGRVRHLLGQFSGAQGATKYYQLARVADEDIARGPAVTEVEMQDFKGKITPDEWQLAGNRFIQLATIAKHDASYWLGLIAFEHEHYKTAADYFSKRTLDVNPDSPWQSGAMYNLARAEEAAGLTDDAIELYRQIDSPQRHGNMLRARWLEEGRE